MNFRGKSKTEYDYEIACDKGYKYALEMGIIPDVIIGDFDSYEKPVTKIPVIHLPCEKDDTDTFFAIKEALKLGFSEFILIGSIGNRFDHSLCNISALLFLNDNNAKATIIDDFSEMILVDNKNPAQVDSKYSFFSLMNVTGDVDGVTILNAKYPLENAKIKSSYQYGISNEVVKGKTAQIFVKEGILLLVKVW